MLDWFDDAAADGSGALSEAAGARRAAIRSALTTAVVRRRRRAKAVNAGFVAVAAALLLAVCWPANLPLPGEAPPRIAVGQRIDVAVVSDVPGILARYRVAPSAPRPEVWVTDEQLLDLLHSANRPTGLIRVQDRVMFTHDVTDALGE